MRQLTIPSIEELLGAMQGRYDPSHPGVEILRAAWLLAIFDQWFVPRAVLAVHSVDSSESAPSIESGSEALASLALDLATVSNEALVDRITDAVGSEEYAMAVDQLAANWAAVAKARIHFGSCRGTDDEERLAEAAAEYEAIAACVAAFGSGPLEL